MGSVVKIIGEAAGISQEDVTALHNKAAIIDFKPFYPTSNFANLQSVYPNCFAVTTNYLIKGGSAVVPSLSLASIGTKKTPVGSVETMEVIVVGGTDRVVYGIAGTGNVYYSNEFVSSFTKCTNVPSALFYSSVSLGNRIVFVGSSGNVIYSDDGINFTQASVPAGTRSYKSVAYNGSRLVATDYSGNVIYSDDNALTWQDSPNTIPIPSGGGFVNQNSMTYGNGLFVAVCNDAMFGATGDVIFTSPDGINWTKITQQLDPSGNMDNLNVVKYIREWFVAAGGTWDSSLIMSKDGVTWERIQTAYGQTSITDIIEYKNKVLLCSDQNTNSLAFYESGSLM